MNCDICGAQLILQKDTIYCVTEPTEGIQLLPTTRPVWDATDCPTCGTQHLLKKRLPKFEPKPEEERHAD